MIPLADKTNSIAPTSTYPYGDMKDNPGDGSGNKVNRNFFNDYVQYHEKCMYIAATGTSADVLVSSTLAAPPNNTPDNAVNGWQLFYALCKIIVLAIQGVKADQATVNAGTDDNDYITSLKLTTFLKNPMTWVAFTFSNLWGNTTSQIPCKYAINCLGNVFLKGNCSNATITLPSTITTLPAGFRPLVNTEKPVYFISAANGDNVLALILIDTSGNVTLTKVSSNFTSGDGGFLYGFDLSFPTT